MNTFEHAINTWNRKRKEAEKQGLKLKMSTNIQERVLEEKLLKISEKVKKEEDKVNAREKRIYILKRQK